MKQMILFSMLIFCFSSYGADQWCKLVRKADSKILARFQGDCTTFKWAGEWGDPKLVKQEIDPAKQAEWDASERDKKDQEAIWKRKQEERDLRKHRIQSLCQDQTGLMREICDEILK